MRPVFSNPNLNSPYVIIGVWCKHMLQVPKTLNITLTDKAAEKVRTSMGGQGKKDSGLRLYVSGGGCSGFQYGLAFDVKNEGDQVVESHGVSILVDEQSAQYLEGSEIDYVESVMGEGFIVNNPNAVETCGCGLTFFEFNSFAFHLSSGRKELILSKVRLLKVA
jgi:iron-sulfur cluster assembly accessory protein